MREIVLGHADVFVHMYNNEPYVGYTHIKLDFTVKTIPAGFFSSLKELESVVGTSVTRVEKEAFLHCEALKHVELAKSVYIVGPFAFAYCISLRAINFDVEHEVGDHSFYRAALQTVKLSVKHVNNAAFRDCFCLYKVVFSDCKGLNRFAFLDCSKLQHVDLPASLLNIGCGAFSGTGLKVLDLSKCVNLSRFAGLYRQGLRGVLLHPDVHNYIGVSPIACKTTLFANHPIDRLKFLRLAHWSKETFHEFSTQKETIRTVLTVACKELLHLPSLPHFIWLHIIRIGFD